MSTKPRYRENQWGERYETADLVHWGTGFTDTNYGPYLVSNNSEWMSDFVVENYKKLIASGAIINNPCSMYRYTMKSDNAGHVRYDLGSKGFNTTGPTTAHYATTLNFSTTSATIDLDGAEARCKLVALAGIDSTPYAFGEDALELRETIRFVKNPVASLKRLSASFRNAYYDLLRIRSSGTHKGMKLWQYFRKEDIGLLPSKVDAALIAKAHAQVWLSYRFALAPLVRSSLDAISAYAIKTPSPPDRRTSDGVFSISDTDISPNVVYSGKHYYEKDSKSVDGHAYIMYQVDNPIYDWKYRLGLRAKDIPATIWQIVPYSFMVDRLLDVSSFAKAVTNLADPSVKILAAGYREKYTHEWEYKFISRDLTGFSVLSPETRSFKEFTYKRDVWGPNIGDAVPRLSPEYFVDNATYVVDTIALILGRLRIQP